MTQLVLSTGNVMSAGPSIIRKSGLARSNLELLNGLRDNFTATRHDYPSATATTNGDRCHKGPISQGTGEGWMEHDGNSLFIPRVNWLTAGLLEDSSEYEITVKLFLLAGSKAADREQHIKDALSLVSKELRLQAIDLLILAFPGLSFEGDCEWKADRLNAEQGNLDEEIETWKVVENLHQQGIVKRLGVSEFGSQKLEAFLERASIPPAVDQVNLKDCCNVPPPLKKLAEAKQIELNVHTDCTDVLPRGTLRELLAHEKVVPSLPNGTTNGTTASHTEILPQWVVRYTAFIRDRGVIENKGYFASALLQTV